MTNDMSEDIKKIFEDSAVRYERTAEHHEQSGRHEQAALDYRFAAVEYEGYGNIEKAEEMRKKQKDIESRL